MFIICLAIKFQTAFKVLEPMKGSQKIAMKFEISSMISKPKIIYFRVRGAIHSAVNKVMMSSQRAWKCQEWHSSFMHELDSAQTLSFSWRSFNFQPLSGCYILISVSRQDRTSVDGWGWWWWLDILGKGRWVLRYKNR